MKIHRVITAVARLQMVGGLRSAKVKLPISVRHGRDGVATGELISAFDFDSAKLSGTTSSSRVGCQCYQVAVVTCNLYGDAQ